MENEKTKYCKYTKDNPHGDICLYEDGSTKNCALGSDWETCIYGKEYTGDVCTHCKGTGHIRQGEYV